ncbi:glucoside xylosyltransferase 1-like [Choristoneura fumiferana]|uniref:glucoside xylosyltransferase 1-like n=1 Tax=Choristoneura fumiferana TaxID=7141 RepID=UPI003D15DE20
MRLLPLWKIVLLFSFSFLLLYLYSSISSDDVKRKANNGNDKVSSTKLITLGPEKSGKGVIKRIVLSFVVCDSRFKESLNVVKSVLLFTKTPVHFVIFTDDELRLKFNKTLSEWRISSDQQLDFELHKINFPAEYAEEWMNLFSKCAAQRLFIPKLIPHIDSMIYVDTDTLFLGPADELWDIFSEFNSSHISALAVENDNPNVSWYTRFAKHPFYGKYGLNSGVMLMNLTRMRDFGWVDYVTPIMLKWKLYIPWGDQDIINVIFHYHGRAVLELSCRYNYRTDQCMYGDACADAVRRGVFLLHGSRKAFHTNKQPAFQALYRAVEEYKFGSDAKDALFAMERYLAEAPPSPCGNLKDAFLKVPSETIYQLDQTNR